MVVGRSSASVCGIAGIVDMEGAPPDRLGPMLACIQHRGPDDTGNFIEAIWA